MTDFVNSSFSPDGNVSFQNVYIYGTLYYDFDDKDITFKSLNVTGNSTLGDLTVNNFNVSVDAKVTGITTVNNIEITGTLKDGDGDTGSAGQVLSFDGTDLEWINTSSANVGSASKVGVNLDSDSTTTMYLTFVDSTSGNEEIRVDKSLTYKPSTGSFLGIATFTNIHITAGVKDTSGDVGSSGQVLSATGTVGGGTNWINVGDISAGTASSISVTANSANKDQYIPFINETSGTQQVRADAGLKYNPNTDTLKPGRISLADDDEIRFGNGNDLKISHTMDLSGQNDVNGDSVLAGSNWCSLIEDSGTGPLIFKSDGGPSSGAFQWYDTGWRPILKLFSGTGARAALYYAGSEKFITTTDGVKITGGIQDKDANLGTSGQILSSTGTQLDWIDPSGESDTLDTVCDRGSSTNQNITTSGSLNDAAGNVREIVNNTKTGVYTLTANDVGELINTNSNVTIPSGVFSAGQAITIYNNSSGNITIARSGVTAYSVGTSTNSDKTLAQKGVATVMCVSANTFVVIGGGLS